MDNEEDLKEQKAEEQYLKENAKYKIGDIVGFIHNCIPTIGVVTDISFKYVTYSNNNNKFTVITYTIITPTFRIVKDECELFAAADYICRHYCKIPV